ncbi:MAG: mechanosensitive ion channel family protein [Granulosicoccus sp.]
MLSEQTGAFLTENWLVYIGLLLINLLLIFFAARIVRILAHEDTSSNSLEFRTNVLRGFNGLAIALVGYLKFYGAGQSGQGLGIKVLSILVVLYVSYLLAHLCAYFVRQRLGRAVKSGDVDRIADTYASRALAIFISVFIGIIALISIIRIAGFSSLLEAGGVIGFIGVFLALTQSAWAPDLISGLVILNTKMLQERDVVKLNDSHETFYATVYRTRPFYTELLNLVDNHRVMIRNAKIRDYTIHNLSRFASAKGLRETLKFKIGYDTSPDKVKAMFEAAFVSACEDSEIAIETQHPLEIRIQDTGDHAVEWSIHYYTKNGAALIKTRQFFREKVLNAAREATIDLSTPVTLHQK